MLLSVCDERINYLHGRYETEASSIGEEDIDDDIGVPGVHRPAYLGGSRGINGRLGLLTATAVQVHPHFHGCLTLELTNLGTLPLVLTPGERICQLVVSPARPSEQPPPAKYFCGTAPEFSRVRDDPESAVLKALRGCTYAVSRGLLGLCHGHYPNRRAG